MSLRLKKTPRKKYCTATLVMLTAIHAAHANTPLTAIDTREALRLQEQQNQLRQQQEQANRQPIQSSVAPSEALAPPLGKIPKQETPCVPLKRIQLEGKHAQQFRWLTSYANVMESGEKDPALPGCLGTEGINILMQRLQRALEQHGFITTKVLFYRQSFKDETLKLQLYPGIVHKIRLVSATPPYVRTRNAVPLAPGQIINVRELDQALDTFNRVPSSHATVILAEPETPNAPLGSSDVVVNWKQTRPYRLTLGVDNSGNRSTGIYQGSLTFAIDNLLHSSDLFYVSGNHELGGGDSGSRSNKSITVHYSIPWRYWLLGFTTNSSTYYQTIASAIAPYTYSGESDNYELKLSRLMYRDKNRETKASMMLWHKKSRNYIEDVEIDIQRRRTAGWEFGISHREAIKAATLDIQLAYRQGEGFLNSLPAPEEAIGDGSSHPQTLTINTYFNLPFTLGQHRLRYTNQIRAQWNFTPLIPQDRFAIGGRYTVRGFDGEQQLLAERGGLMRNDLGLMLGESGQEAYIGLDAGIVGGKSAAFLVGKELVGAAFGLRGGYKAISYDATIGMPLYKPPGFITASPVVTFTLYWNL